MPANPQQDREYAQKSGLNVYSLRQAFAKSHNPKRLVTGRHLYFYAKGVVREARLEDKIRVILDASQSGKYGWSLSDAPAGLANPHG